MRRGCCSLLGDHPSTSEVRRKGQASRIRQVCLHKLRPRPPAAAPTVSTLPLVSAKTVIYFAAHTLLQHRFIDAMPVTIPVRFSGREFLLLELACHIAQELEGDTASLQSCSLVSRSWLAAARPTLFQSIYVDNTTNSGRHVAGFLIYLEEYPNLYAYVQEIAIRHGLTPLDEIPVIVLRLPRLQHLLLDTTDIPPFSHPDSIDLPRIPEFQKHPCYRVQHSQ